MFSLIENMVFTFIVIMLVIVCYIGAVEYSKQLDKEEIQALTYTECLATDYDKFQCYSMIYGDK